MERGRTDETLSTLADRPTVLHKSFGTNNADLVLLASAMQNVLNFTRETVTVLRERTTPRKAKGSVNE